MSSQVMPLHYVTVEFRLHDQDRIIEKAGQHRFLYGVEPWIDGVDQQLENLREGDHLQLSLDPDTAAFVASRLLSREERPKFERGLALELEVVEVVKAEPKEVVKALAATVHCCDHCGGH
jgi:FKBP-type peptidyl-prolyl cis-trans isomerase 2